MSKQLAMHVLVRTLVLCGLALLMWPGPASACSCAIAPACTAFYAADAVFIGQAEVEKTGPGSQRARFRIDESFRGPASKGGLIEIVAKGIGGSCDFEFVDGVRYLVYARKRPDGGWGAFLCGRTVVLDSNADEDLALARSIARNPSGPGRVHGNASIGEPTGRGYSIGTGTLAGISVSLRNDDQTFTVETDPRGMFEFPSVLPGRYTLTVRLSPRFEPVPPATVTVAGAGACAIHSIVAVRRRFSPISD